MPYYIVWEWVSIYHLKTVYQHKARSKSFWFSMFSLHIISLKIYKTPTFCHPNEIDGYLLEWKLDYVFYNSNSYFWRVHHFTVKKPILTKKKKIILNCYFPRQHIVETYWDRICSSVYIDKFDLNDHFISVFISYDITCSVHIHNSLNIL